MFLKNYELFWEKYLQCQALWGFFMIALVMWVIFYIWILQ
jgi:hypothetical protein